MDSSQSLPQKILCFEQLIQIRAGIIFAQRAITGWINRFCVGFELGIGNINRVIEIPSEIATSSLRSSSQ